MQRLIDAIRDYIRDPKGWCYSASEALYYLAAKEAGYKPVQGVTADKDGYISHWWLEKNGEVLDITSDQFDFEFPYEVGRGRGFQTNMKNDTKEIIEYVRSLPST